MYSGVLNNFVTCSYHHLTADSDKVCTCICTLHVEDGYKYKISWLAVFYIILLCEFKCLVAIPMYFVLNYCFYRLLQN